MSKKRKSASGHRRTASNSKHFSDIYFSTSSPYSYGGKQRFLRGVRKKFGSSKSIRQQALNWIKGVDTYTLHRPVLTGRTKFRRQTIVSGIDSTWQADLADLPQFVESNDGVRYILFVIDVFSRYAWCRPLRSKSGDAVARAMEDIFQQSSRQPKRIQTDLGKEFMNARFKGLMRERSIHHYYSENRDTKAALVERLQRTIKDKLYRYFTHSSSYRYIDELQNMVNAYNNTVHSVIKHAPIDVTQDCQEEVWNNQYNSDPEAYDQRLYSSRFKPADMVRVSKIKNTFEKGSVSNWSEELFKIDKVLTTKPITYTITDLGGEPISGSWYSWELQKVRKTDGFYKIEKILKRKRLKNGKVKYLVKFLGYDSRFNEWIDDIMDYSN